MSLILLGKYSHDTWKSRVCTVRGSLVLSVSCLTTCPVYPLQPAQSAPFTSHHACFHTAACSLQGACLRDWLVVLVGFVLVYFFVEGVFSWVHGRLCACLFLGENLSEQRQVQASAGVRSVLPVTLHKVVLAAVFSFTFCSPVFSGIHEPQTTKQMTTWVLLCQSPQLLFLKDLVKQGVILICRWENWAHRVRNSDNQTVRMTPGGENVRLWRN